MDKAFPEAREDETKPSSRTDVEVLVIVLVVFHKAPASAPS